MSKRHALYRFYGDTGQLLYVGVTSDPARRFGQHASTKAWWESVRGISLEWYSSRGDLQAAEKRAIEVERPLMNLQRPHLRPVPAEAPRCGHCTSCRDPLPDDPNHCSLYGPISEDEDRVGGTCAHCGQEGCLYAMGYEEGNIDGYMVGSRHRRAVDRG